MPFAVRRPPRPFTKNSHAGRNRKRASISRNRRSNAASSRCGPHPSSPATSIRSAKGVVPDSDTHLRECQPDVVLVGVGLAVLVRFGTAPRPPRRFPRPAQPAAKRSPSVRFCSRTWSEIGQVSSMRMPTISSAGTARRSMLQHRSKTAFERSPVEIVGIAALHH